MSDLTPMQMLEIECKKLLAECERLGKELHASRRETIELRAAARAALAALDDPHGDLVVYCDGDDGAGLRCYSIASRADDLDARCDRHEWPELEELSYAPALRRLRALVEVKP